MKALKVEGISALARMLGFKPAPPHLLAEIIDPAAGQPNGEARQGTPESDKTAT
jgi:hypothetical protein